MTGAPEPLLVEAIGHVLVMTMNRPEARNAMNLAMAESIAAAVQRLDGTPELRVGVLAGAGGAFCAGMDLKAFLKGELPVIPGAGFAGLVERPPDKPLIAAIEGWAVGGGLELALSCDLVIAGESARLGLPEVTRGLIAGAGGLIRLPQRVPPAIAMEMALTGLPLESGRACDHGLVNRVVADGTARDEAIRLAEVIAANGPFAVRSSKQIMRESADWASGEWPERQRAVLDRVNNSEEAREGATAFAEKRPPRWP